VIHYAQPFSIIRQETLDKITQAPNSKNRKRTQLSIWLLSKANKEFRDWQNKLRIWTQNDKRKAQWADSSKTYRKQSFWLRSLNWKIFAITLCCDRKARAACALSFALWQQATIGITLYVR